MKPNGSKLWKLFYRVDGRMKTLSLGPYPDVSLARAKRQEAKAVLADGADPMALAKADRKRKQALEANTFAAIAEEMLAKSERQELNRGPPPVQLILSSVDLEGPCLAAASRTSSGRSSSTSFSACAQSS